MFLYNYVFFALTVLIKACFAKGSTARNSIFVTFITTLVETHLLEGPDEGHLKKDNRKERRRKKAQGFEPKPSSFQFGGHGLEFYLCTTCLFSVCILLMLLNHFFSFLPILCSFKPVLDTAPQSVNQNFNFHINKN